MDQALSVDQPEPPRAESTANSPADTESVAARTPGPPGSLHDGGEVSRALVEEIRTLAEWAAQVTDFRNLGGLAAALTSGLDLPPAVRQAWESLSSRELTDLVAEQPLPLESLLQRLLDRLEERERKVLLARTLGTTPTTLQKVADELGITRERVRQLQLKAETRVADLLTQPEFSPLAWAAHAFRDLGASFPSDSPALVTRVRELTDSSDHPRPELTTLLLRLAGYEERASWLVRADAAPIGRGNLEQLADRDGLIESDRVREVLDEAGVAQDDHDALLERLGGFRRLGAFVTVWKGSVVDKAVAILAVLTKPATAEELVDRIGERHNVRSLRNRLYEDDRVMRVSKNEWALRSWQMEEYTGVADEIAEEIGRQGGSSSLLQLTETLSARFGIAPSSVRAYAQTPQFVIENGLVRLRESDEPYSVETTVPSGRGCFLLSDDVASYFVEVDSELLRGSGRSLPVGLAAFLGIGPGGERRLVIEPEEAARATLLVSWPADSVAGPTLGSLWYFALRDHLVREISSGWRSISQMEPFAGSESRQLTLRVYLDWSSYRS